MLLTPLLLAPEENVELNIRNYSNFGGLSISNATGRVHIPTGITTGAAGLIQEGNIPVRHLLIDHDIGQKFRVGTTVVLALEETTGATVQGGLSVNGNCTVTGQLVVGSTNILDALTNAAQSSTAPIAVADVTGLTVALARKQALLGANSTVQLSELTCSRVKPASSTLSLADSGGVRRTAGDLRRQRGVLMPRERAIS